MGEEVEFTRHEIKARVRQAIDAALADQEISYLRMSAILTVVAGNVPVPDHGSTFLLLTLGLLG